MEEVSVTREHNSGRPLDSGDDGPGIGVRPVQDGPIIDGVGARAASRASSPLPAGHSTGREAQNSAEVCTGMTSKSTRSDQASSHGWRAARLGACITW